MKTNNKLREAMLSIRADILKRRSENVWYITDSDTLEKIDAALAAPPRNCDVGTSDEQAERFENFCLKHIGCAEETGGRHCVGCPLEKASRNITQSCELYWAQLPYVEKEGGAK